MNIPFRNIRQLLSLQAKVAPDKVFLRTRVSHEKWEELTYAEFNARAHQAANLLHTDFGVKAGDVVAIIDDHPGDVAVLLMACWLIGAVAMPFDLEDQEVITLRSFHLTRNSICLIRDELIPQWNITINKILKSEQIITIGGQQEQLNYSYPHFNTLVKSMPNTFISNDSEPSLNSAAIIPQVKKAPLSQIHLLLPAQSLSNSQAITGNQHLINVLPFHNTFGQSMLMTTLFAGTSLVHLSHFKPQTFWHEIAAGQIHLACLDSTNLHGLIIFAKQQKQDGNSIYGKGIYQQDIKQFRHIICPYPGITKALIRSFIDLFPFPVMVGYGNQTTGGFCSILPNYLTWAEYCSRMFDFDGICVGSPLDGYSITIQDPDGKFNGAYERGEVCIRGPKTKSHLSNEWLHTGDTGFYVHEPNQLFYYL